MTNGGPPAGSHLLGNTVALLNHPFEIFGSDLVGVSGPDGPTEIRPPQFHRLRDRARFRAEMDDILSLDLGVVLYLRNDHSTSLT